MRPWTTHKAFTLAREANRLPSLSQRGDDIVKRAIFIFVAVLLAIASFPLNAAASDYEITHIGQNSHDMFAASQDGGFAVSHKRKLMIFDSSAEKVIETVLPSNIKAMAFGQEGSLFIAYGTILAKFDADGREAWESEANEEIVAITILPDGSPAVGHSYGIQAFNDEGSSLWEYYPHEECDF